MAQPAGIQITCPNCHQPFQGVLEQLIDGGREPQVKARLLSGRLNMAVCPNCHYQSMLTTPLIYHDGSKELLITFLPMELGLSQADQQKAIGSLTNAVVNSLPPEARKGYLFTPKMALTYQGLIEMILEADGVTKEMIEAQRMKMQLAQAFLQAEPVKWPDMVREHDAELDMEFFSILTATAQAAMAEGRRDAFDRVVGMRDQLLQLSSVGKKALQDAEQQEKMIQDVANAVNALGQKPTRDDFVDLVIRFAAESDDKVQALVGLTRPVMDYQFFQTFTARIDAADGDEKAKLTAARDRLLELVDIIDQENKALIDETTTVLENIVELSKTTGDLDAAISENSDRIDETFLAVLSAHVEKAEQAGDTALAAQLQTIFDKSLALLQQNVPPVVKFVSELLSQPDINEAKSILMARGHEFGPDLVQWMDILADDLEAQGANPAALERLGELRDEAARTLNTGDELSARRLSRDKMPDLSEDGKSEQKRPKLRILPSSKRPNRE